MRTLMCLITVPRSCKDRCCYGVGGMSELMYCSKSERPSGVDDWVVVG